MDEKLQNIEKFFKYNLERLSFEIVDFISKVPTDDHMFIEGGKFYEGESMQK